jgi:hypothetical protein
MLVNNCFENSMKAVYNITKSCSCYTGPSVFYRELVIRNEAALLASCHKKLSWPAVTASYSQVNNQMRSAKHPSIKYSFPRKTDGLPIPYPRNPYQIWTRPVNRTDTWLWRFCRFPGLGMYTCNACQKWRERICTGKNGI